MKNDRCRKMVNHFFYTPPSVLQLTLISIPLSLLETLSSSIFQPFDYGRFVQFLFHTTVGSTSSLLLLPISFTLFPLVFQLFLFSISPFTFRFIVLHNIVSINFSHLPLALVTLILLYLVRFSCIESSLPVFIEWPSSSEEVP